MLFMAINDLARILARILQCVCMRDLDVCPL